MSDKKQRDKRHEQDLFSTIPSPEELDIFSDLDLDGMCMPPLEEGIIPDSASGDSASITPPPLFEMNPLNDINIQNIAVQGDQTILEEDSLHVDAEPSGKAPPFSSLLQPEPSTESPKIHTMIHKIAEQIELSQLRESIINKLSPKNSHIVLLMSPDDGTGQTLITTALGYNTAMTSGKSILLMDCNMRNPSLHSYLGIKPQNGLTNMIREKLSWRGVIKATELPNLHIMANGTVKFESFTNLQRNYFPHLFKSLKDFFDIIFIDSSPILRNNRGNIDTVWLSSMVDYSALIVNMNATTKKQLKETIEVIQTINGKIDSIICNHRPTEPLHVSLFNKLRKRRG